MIFGGPTRKAPSRDLKEALYKKQKGRCNYCGIKLSMSYFHVDHKTPVAREGKDSIANSQLLCGPCNTRKGRLTDGEFRRRYRLTPTRQTKGPPARPKSQAYFEKISKAIADKKAKARRREDNW